MGRNIKGVLTVVELRPDRVSTPLVRDIKFLYFSVKSKKLIVLIYKLIIIIKNRGFIFRLFLVYGQIVTRISVLCDLTNILYIQNFVPSLQIGNLKEKGLKLILTLKDKVPPFLGRFLLGTQLTTSSFKESDFMYFHFEAVMFKYSKCFNNKIDKQINKFKVTELDDNTLFPMIDSIPTLNSLVVDNPAPKNNYFCFKNNQ
ncbi:hypothetical protein Anas_06034 [Armadillidium nasatum]|uniref:Uncharacterized protein n=1 Tax=Armadillidium nasatum TaxID=96803 RepID=A0A5N5TIS4_9CRUS|nr:hypothetical protein Anas_06034 [Armadillidium nasatum]